MIVALDGFDDIHSLDGNDVICAGEGNDQMDFAGHRCRSQCRPGAGAGQWDRMPELM